MLSGRGLCDELITRPEESHRLWYVVVCDLEKLKNEEAMTRVGSQRHRGKKSVNPDLPNSINDCCLHSKVFCIFVFYLKSED